MSTSAIVTLVVVVVVLALVVLLVWPIVRRRRLQQRFGPEYDRTVADHDSRSAAERELMERERRHRQFELKPLSPEARERYARQWIDVQARFVDAPEQSVAEADSLVTTLMAERGYPVEGDHEQRAAALSVEHAATLEHYRAGHDAHSAADRGEASTEQLREAMVHYRVIFTDLLDLHDEDAGDRRDDSRDGAYADRDDADGAYADRDGAYAERDGAYPDRDGARMDGDGAYAGREDMRDGEYADGRVDAEDADRADAADRTAGRRTNR
jgi:hypothetical protein